MEDQASLRGQGFTLLVFAGVVALCSVFFILGMIVGRGQAPGETEAGSATSASSPEANPGAESSAELGFYETVTQGDFPEPETPAPPEIGAASAPAPAEDAAPSNRASLPDTDVVAIMLQVGAFGVEQTANNVVAELGGRGFRAMVLRPVPGEGPALYRVQVGPLPSEEEASRVRARLLDAGYQVITVR
jgi:cell division septation protein DedD